MTLEDLRKKKICILGLGIENHALLNFLLKKNLHSDITIADARSKHNLLEHYQNLKISQLEQMRWRTGQDYDASLDEFDVIFRIAGYPLFNKNIIKAMMKGVSVSSATKLFFELSPTKNIIGVTGAKGKGTTGSLIYKILKDAGQRAHFGGNIGIPIFSFFEKIKTNDWVVLELSSFQLEDLHLSPHIAVFTNFHREHLASADPNNPNYHKTLSSYWDAKLNIVKHQTKHDFAVISENLKNKIAKNGLQAKIIYFNSSKLKTSLLGNHNKKNIAAAEQVAKIAGVKPKTIANSVKNFKGLEHRLEFVAQKNNIRYYNDTFATTPEAAITALVSFEPKRVVLIAGGSSKNSDFKILANKIKQYAKHVLMFPGKGSDEMKAALAKVKYDQITKVKNMSAAVNKASRLAGIGSVVLLSPACASFGIFRDYKDRGRQFKLAVKQL